MTHTLEPTPVAVTATGTQRARNLPFSAGLAAAALVLGAAGNTAQAVLGQVLGGRPDTVGEQIALAQERTGLFIAMEVVGTVAVPFMALGFVAAAHLLHRRARRTGTLAGALLCLGMFGFIGMQVGELVQLSAMLDPAGHDAARYLDGMDSSVLLNVLFGLPFGLGCVLGMVLLSIALLVKGAGVPRWIPGMWLAFIVLDFSVGGVGPVDPHWLYLFGAVGLAVHVTRSGGKAWANA